MSHETEKKQQNIYTWTIATDKIDWFIYFGITYMIYMIKQCV